MPWDPSTTPPRSFVHNETVDAAALNRSLDLAHYYRGQWAAGTAYAVRDLVLSAGALYRRLIAGTTSTEPESDAANWTAATWA